MAAKIEEFAATSVKPSISLGPNVLVVSTKPGNVPGQVTLQKISLKNDIFFLVMSGRHPDFLSRTGVKAGPLDVC